MIDPPTRPARGRRARLLAAVVVVVGLGWVPVATVNACSCAFFGYPEAIAQSDVAFIGTMVARGGSERLGDRWETTRVGFDVDRAKDTMPTPVVVDARLGSGASCGLEMAIGEVWFVIAHFQDGRAGTNLCSGSTLLDGMDEPTRQLVTAALDAEPVPANGEDDPLAGMSNGAPLSGTPLGVFLAGGAVLLVAIVSLGAFRRSRPG
jgi:hypothetical protein